MRIIYYKEGTVLEKKMTDIEKEAGEVGRKDA